MLERMQGVVMNENSNRALHWEEMRRVFNRGLQFIGAQRIGPAIARRTFGASE